MGRRRRREEGATSSSFCLSCRLGQKTNTVRQHRRAYSDSLTTSKFLSSQWRSRCRVGRGWVVASQSQQEGWLWVTLKGGHRHTHTHTRICFSCSHQPNSHGIKETTHNSGTGLLSIQSWEPIASALLWPRAEPKRFPALRPSTHKRVSEPWVCLCGRVFSVHRANLLRSCGIHIAVIPSVTKQFLWLLADNHGDSVVRGEWNVCRHPAAYVCVRVCICPDACLPASVVMIMCHYQAEAKQCYEMTLRI